MITSKTRETRHSGALSRVQDNKPASPHIGCCLTPKCTRINSNGNLPRPSSLGVTAISTGGEILRLASPREIKWHACALSLAQANAPSFTPIDTDLAFQMRPLSPH